MKNRSSLTIKLGLTIFSSIVLTGCLATMPTGMSGLGGGMPSLGGARGMSNASGMATGSSGGPKWKSPINNPNAKVFSDNLVKLEVDKSTKDDALTLLGNPGIKNPVSGGECWQYPLNTGAMPAIAWLYFKNSTLVGVEVIKTSFQGPIGGGTVSAEPIYSRGIKLMP